MDDTTQSTATGAEEGADAAQGAATGADTTGAQSTTATSYTQEQLDKAVADAVEKAKSKWQTDADEAARLAKMSKDEREKAEFEKAKAQFEKDKAALERDRLISATGKELLSRKLPDSFAAVLTGTDADSTKANIDSFEKSWSAAVEAAVNDRLKGKAPQTGGGSGAVKDLFLQGFDKM